MTVEVKMPALSPTMEKGTLAKWLIAEGDMVRPGDLIAEIETDKATMEVEAADEGRVTQLVIAEGTSDVPVGSTIALLGSADETAAVPSATPAQIAAPMPAEDVAPTPSQATIAAPLVTANAPPIVIDNGAAASPLARRIAAAKQIDLSTVKGSGPRGKIVKADLGLPMPAILQPAGLAPVQTLAAPIIAPPPAGVPVETTKLSTMRKTIARRLTESKQTVPHFYLTARCNLNQLLALRGELNASLASRNVKLSVNDMLIKALALALTDVPDANVQFGGDTLHRFSRVDVSMAVAIDGGLITPVIQDAGALSLSSIAAKSKTLAAKARDNKLSPEEYQGGTVSISNLGMFGIDEMFPVINPPQALILGVGAGIEQPWKVDGGLGLATIMAATASFDHRAIDGAVAAQFMAALRTYVEDPRLLLA